MARARVGPDADDFTDLSKKPKADVKKGAGAGAATSLQKGSNVGGQGRNMNFILGRNKSPTGGDGKDVPNTCDLAAQQGVKIYSDLK